jgi:hypothetical protein
MTETKTALDPAVLGLSERANEETVTALAANAVAISDRLLLLADGGGDDLMLAELQTLRTRPAVELRDLAAVARHLGLADVVTTADDAYSVRTTSGGPARPPLWFTVPPYAPPSALAVPDPTGPDVQAYLEVVLAEADDALDGGLVRTLATGWVQVLFLHGADSSSDDAHRAGRALCSAPGCTTKHGVRSVYPCATREVLTATLPE